MPRCVITWRTDAGLSPERSSSFVQRSSGCSSCSAGCPVWARPCWPARWRSVSGRPICVSMPSRLLCGGRVLLTISRPVSPPMSLRTRWPKVSLAAGAAVVVDAVNPVEDARRGWRDLAHRVARPLRFIEVVCLDESEHRRRVASRTADLEEHTVPTWTDVQNREYEPWTEPASDPRRPASLLAHECLAQALRLHRHLSPVDHQVMRLADLSRLTAELDGLPRGVAKGCSTGAIGGAW